MSQPIITELTDLDASRANIKIAVYIGYVEITPACPSTSLILASHIAEPRY